MRRLLRVLLAAVLLQALAGGAEAQQGLVGFERDELVLRTAAGAAHRFAIELALSREQQVQGLMYRPSLPATSGMLFVYRPSRRLKMWMKNTVIPLDMLFIAEDGRIVKIVERAVPYSTSVISSGEPVRAVLELNGGTAARLGIAPGDLVEYRMFDAAR